MWRFSAWIWAKRHLQHTFLSTNIEFNDIFSQARVIIKISRFWTRKWPLFLGISFSFLRSSFITYPYLFNAPSTALASSSIFFWESKHHRDRKILPQDSRRKFCCEFFTQISRRSIFVHISGSIEAISLIIGRIFSCCITWVQMMPILIKGDNIWSGTKVNTCHGRLQAAFGYVLIKSA